MKKRLVLSGAALLTVLTPAVIHAQAVPTGVQEYYLVGHAEQLYEMLQAAAEVGEGCGQLSATRGMNVVTTLTATTDIQQVIYDHWEDGFEPDPLAPVQASTLVLGDGNTANGDAVNFGGLAGDLINTDVALSWVSSDDTGSPGTIDDYVPYPRPTAPLELRYDAPDRLVIIGGPVNLVHTEEPRNPFIGGAMTVYPRQLLGASTDYLIPVGTDLYDPAVPVNDDFEPFQYVYLQLLSYDDNTTITVDNGAAAPVTFQLDEGDVWSSLGKINLVDVPAAALVINAGTQVTADGAVTALLVTGGDGCFSSRFYSLLPEALFGTDYVTPVYGDGPTNGNREKNLYIYNPHSTNLDVTAYDTVAPGGTTLTVPAQGVVAYSLAQPDGAGRDVPAGSTVRLTSDRHFWGVGAVSYTDPSSDWGYGWVPAGMMVDTAAMSWAPGNGAAPPSGDTNSSPVWVAPLMDGTEVQVDLDGDGLFEQADIDGDGTADAFTGSNGYLVDSLQTLRIYDYIDRDQTGVRVRATNRIVVAYGQDTEVAPAGGTALDLGYEVLPQDQRFIDQILSVTLTADRQAVPGGGGDVVFTAEVRSFNSGPVTQIDVSHLLPDPWTLVGTGTVTPPAASPYTSAPTITAVGSDTLLTWDIDEVLDAGELLTVTFTANIAGTAADARYDHEAGASGLYGGRVYNPKDDLAIVKSPLQLDLVVDSAEARPGETLTYTATITNTNTSGGPINGVEVRIPVPADTYIPAPLPAEYDGGCSCLIFNIGSLAAAASQVVGVTVTVSDDAPIGGTITNDARATSGSTPEILSQVVTTLVRAPDLVATLSAQAFTVDNWVYPYTIQLTNAGNEDATGVFIQMDVPASTTYEPGSMEISIGGGPFSPLTDAADADAGQLITGTPDQVRIDLATLAIGGLVAVRFDVQTGSGLADGTQITGLAQVDSNETPLEDSNTVITTVDNTGDADGDGLSNTDEINTYLTDPFDQDTDDDGLSDGDEVNGTGPLAGFAPTNPLNYDSDTDGLFDGTEVGVVVAMPDTDVGAGHFRSDLDSSTTTDPNNPDSDAGGVADGAEDANQNGRVDGGETDPNVWADEDGDGDGLTNGVEDVNGDMSVGAGETDPFDADSDDDGALDGAETDWNLDSDGDLTINALDPDSDDDGLNDGLEIGVAVAGPDTNIGAGNFVADTDPSTSTSMVDADTDGDTLWDSTEDANGNGFVDPTETDPNLPDTDGDTYDDAVDCGPVDATVYPGATETPDDGIDQDCNGVDATQCYADIDGDTYGDATVPITALDGSCDAGQSETADDTDCDDADGASYPGATETPGDGIDQDCNGVDAAQCYADADGDTYGDATVPITALDGSCDAGQSETADDTDCDDADGASYPGASETPDDGIDQDCNGIDATQCYADVDGDTYGDATVPITALDGSCDAGQSETADDTDCDDADGASYPGASETPDDGIDQDCNGVDATQCYADVDGDTYGDATVPITALDGSCDAGQAETADDTDCDDADNASYPGAAETPDDGIDQDCNGADTVTCIVDADMDGDGTDAGTETLASDGSCDTAQMESTSAGDCDDSDPTSYTAAAEACDGNDNDCDAVIPIDETDDDGDTYVECAGWIDTQGDNPEVTGGGGDCNDADAAVNPGQAEINCNAVDDDCDFGTPDDPNSADADYDGFTVDCGNDCDDSNFFINPVATENCSDGVDNNCDGVVDAADSAACPPGCADADGDGFPSAACTPPGTDCDDGNPTVNPGEAEDCFDGYDNDCDGLADSSDPRCPGTCPDADGDGYPDVTCGGSDCDESRADINPGRTEICSDGIDNDCDGLVDVADAFDCPAGCSDLDSDGYPDAACGGTDCDDTRPTVHPDAGEDCGNGIDDDCDGDVDGSDPECPAGCADDDGDGFSDIGCGGSDCDDTDVTIAPNVVEECTDGVDNNCDGLIDAADPVDCPAGCDDVDLDGFPDIGCGGSDCNDAAFFVNPSAPENCSNGVDDNCDGVIDYDDSASCPAGCADADGDGFLDPACGGNDCDETDASVFPGAAENCSNGIDDDCDGVVDGADPVDCPASCVDADTDGYADIQCGGTDCNDGDGAVSPGDPESLCNGVDDDCNVLTADEPDEDGDGYVASWCAPGDDCRDDLPLVNPGAGESCDDTIDNNCDGLIDANDPLCTAGCTDADNDSYLDQACGGSDCDDSDPNRHPGAGEHCSDGIDNDCDNEIDAADTVDCPVGCPDLDGDGYLDGACGGSDCDDSRFDVNPGGGEQCSDGIDNDCNGSIDEQDAACPADCADADLDGYRDQGCGGSDCDDVDSQVHPGAGEVCDDTTDNNCDGRVDGNDPFCPAGCGDADGDGYADGACGGSDCDDADAATFPGAVELCTDGIDNNCNGQVDGSDAVCPGGCGDADGDGIADASCGGQDCDDSNRRVFPGAGENCNNGIDDNCNGRVDDQDLLCPDGCSDADGDGYADATCGGSDCDDTRADVRPGSSEDCGDGVDNDCDGRIDAADLVDCPAACFPASDLDNDGYPGDDCAGGTDCDDSSASVNPGALEVDCNGIDDDCDPVSGDDPDPADYDGDGFTPGCGNDCDDGNAFINEAATERCDDTRDNNCDGLTDDEDSVACPSGCRDADGDGYLDAGCGGADCDDADYSANPGAGEHCSDGVDNDCDGDTDGADDACDASCPDADADGYRDAACGGSDCNDDDPTVHPGAAEHCSDGMENDCNGLTDDDDVGACPPGCGDDDGDGYPDVACGGTDCDDSFDGTFPAADEQCDGADNDCNGRADEGSLDTDGDGLADCVDPDADGDGWDDAVELSGGGCYCSDSGGSRAGVWLLLLLVPPVLRRWRARSREGVRS